MAEVDAELMVDQVTMLGLVSREQLAEATADADDASPNAVLRSLLRKGAITSWQVDRLKKGDPSGFFYGDAKVLFHLAEGTFARVYRGEHATTAPRSRSRYCASGSPRCPRPSIASTRRPRPA